MSDLRDFVQAQLESLATPVTRETITVHECINPDCEDQMRQAQVFNGAVCMSCGQPLTPLICVWDKSVAYAIEAAERKGFEMARERAAELAEEFPLLGSSQIAWEIRIMKPDGTK